MARLGELLRRLTRDTAGNTLVLTAFALIPLALLVGSGLDISIAYMAKGKLQNACDAGVLAARQSMAGEEFTSEVEEEAQEFFRYNFPEGTARTTDAELVIEQDEADEAQLLGVATASVPTSLMWIGGFTEMDISVECNSTRDMGHNDIMLVLDVTGSMAQAPSSGGGTKIGRLRDGAAGIFRGLDGDDGSVIRFGIVPYSHTVNVARSLTNNDILISQQYVDRQQVCDSRGRNCYYIYPSKTVAPTASSWSRSSNSLSLTAFRTSGNGCIEERPSSGQAASPVRITNTVTRADVDNRSTGSTNGVRQFGRYDPAVQEAESQSGCPSEATVLQTYADEAAFQIAINNATARVTGGTYHDVGMLWGLRFISRTGFFTADNPTERDGIPVNQHIVFMTDGILDTGPTLYSAHGVEQYQDRTQGAGSQDAQHLARFHSACDLAKSMGITIWVIALDVTDTDDVDDCATSGEHFYTSDGSDLESVFEEIGRGIGNLRLTR